MRRVTGGLSSRTNNVASLQGRRDVAPAGGATDDVVVSAPRRSAGPSAAASANGGGGGGQGHGGPGAGSWGGGAFGGVRWSPTTGDLYNPFGDNPLQRAFAGNYKCALWSGRAAIKGLHGHEQLVLTSNTFKTRKDM